MFGTEASKRLKELQSQPQLTKGEEIELRHLVNLKWRSARDVVTFRTPDMKEIEDMVKSKRRG